MKLPYTRKPLISIKIRILFFTVLSAGLLFGIPYSGYRFFSHEGDSAVPDSINRPGNRGMDSVYNALITRADGFYLARQYSEALSEYEKALKIKPADLKLKETIARTQGIIQKQTSVADDYKKAIASGDAYFKAKDYLNAKSAYQMAIDLNPDDPVAKEKLKQTMDLIRSQKAQNMLYDMTIAGAEKYFQAKEYEKAKAEFEKATKISPADTYAKQRINEIIKIMVDAQEKEENYAKAIAAADKFYEIKNYQSALLEYKNASSIKPEEKYPKDRIAELTALIASLKAKNDAYNKAIAAADKAFGAALYADARKEYQNASVIKPEEQYPKNRIREIDNILAGRQRLNNDFDGLVNMGDSLYVEKKYIAAKANYQQALKLKPNEAYPKEMITKADKMISGQEANAQAVEEAYQAAIKSADASFAGQSWDQAKSEYQKAQLIKPDMTYPGTRIAEIDKILADLVKQKSQEEQYQQLITGADKKLEEKVYQEAKSDYQAALKIKPDQSYPKEKIAGIDKILADLAKQKSLDGQYIAAIAKADKSFEANLFVQAKTDYQAASVLKPEESYPRQKITEIDKLLADAASKKALEDKYKSILANADKLFTAKSYPEARAEYSSALEIKPGEPYPTEKLNAIDKILAFIADAKARDEQYARVIENADKLFSEQALEQAKAEYQAALAIKPEESYPKTKIAEIDGKLAAMAKQKGLDEQYSGLIADADRKMEAKAYSEARTLYQSALKLKPAEQYPKDRIAEADKVLAEIAKQKALDEQYAAAVAKADKSFEAKLFTQSKTDYLAASTLKPEESYPKEKIAEIEQLLASAAEKKALDDKYNAIIANADKLLAAKSYSEARTGYSAALDVKPSEQYPKDKISLIDKTLAALADAKARDEQYAKVIENADRLFAAQTWEQAKSEYQGALAIKPEETYPKTKISEIDTKLAAIAKQKALNEQYAGLVAEGDRLFAEKSWAASKASYESALKLKPGEQYPKDKIAEADKALGDIAAQKALDDQYAAAIAKADKSFAGNLLTQAKGEYEAAGQLKPVESYPRQKVAEIDQLLADAAAKKELDEKYSQMIANADKLLASKSYSEARTEYSGALNLKPSEQYPKEKIAEIDKSLAAIADAKAKDEQYSRSVAAADKLFTAQSWEQAKSEYQGALAIKPEETYPKTKIGEIDEKLAAIAKQKALDEQYAGLIREGDRLLAEKSYREAKASYESALKLKPEEQYPKGKISETDLALAEIARQKALDDQYNATISRADKALAENNPEQAKTEYTAAASLKPTETYPKQKIAEIDKMLADLAAQKALDEKYGGIVANADKLLAARSYQEAKKEYSNASGLKPAEQYPKEKIAEIDSITAAIAEAKVRDDKYTGLIQKADKLLAAKTWEQAKTEYQNALAVKPDESYPKSKIAEIDAQLDAIARQKALDEQYTALIREADSKLAEKSYEEAKVKYQSASELKPDQVYPKGKITEIDKSLGDIARQKATDEKYSASITKADKLLAENQLDEAKAEYQNAGIIKPAEAYPKQKIAEVEKLKSEAAQKKALDDKYNSTLQNADKLLAQQNYILAKSEFTNASQLKPSEQYPKDKIAEIEGILADLKAKDDAYNAAIVKADQFLLQKSYEDARNEYNSAAQIKPSEQYPKTKVAEINNILMQLKGKKETYDGLVQKGDDLYKQQDYYRSKENFEQASEIFPEESYPKQRLVRINSVIDSIYRANKGKYDKAVADGDKSYNNLIYDKALDFYGEASSYLPNEKYPRDMIAKIKRAISENAIVDVVKTTIVIPEGTEKQIPFQTIDIASRKNNYLYIKIKNLSKKPFNVLVRYGKDKQMNGGAVIRNLQADGNVYDRLISVRDQDPWYREDNNWIALLPQGGDVEVTFIQISRAVQ